MKKEQLLRFIEIRNASGFSSNLQFSIDAGEAGFKVEELGQAFRQWGEDGQINGYRWDTPYGVLVEHPDGRCELK
jgi:hypothetical protein